MSRWGRLFSASREQGFTVLCRYQLISSRKFYWIDHSGMCCRLYGSSVQLGSRPFSSESIEPVKAVDSMAVTPLNELRKGKVKEILAICKGKSWDTNLEESLGEFSKFLSNHMVAILVLRMEDDMATHFFKWAGRQEGYKHEELTYNVLFKKFVRAGNFDGAVQALRDMRDLGITPSAKKLGTLFHHCGKAGKTSQVNPDIIKSFGLDPDPKLYSALLKALLQNNDVQGEEELVQQLSGDGVKHDIEFFNSLISTCARAGKVDLALKVLEVMEKKECSPDSHTQNLIINCYCKANKCEEAFGVLEMMRESDLVPDIGAYNALISAFCQENKIEDALKVFANMKEAGCTPDIATHNSLVTAWLKSGQASKAQLYVQEMVGEDSTATPETKRMLLVFLCKAEELDKAKAIFETTAEKGETLPIDACNKLLHVLSKAGRLDDALSVYDKMKSGICSPDLASYTILVRCCCNFLSLDKAKELFDELRNRGLKPPVELYVVALDAFSRVARSREVHELCQDLLAGSPSLIEKKATAVLNALTRAELVDDGLKFCDYAMDTKTKIQPLQVKWFLRLLKRKGRGSDALNLMASMLEKSCIVEPAKDLTLSTV